MDYRNIKKMKNEKIINDTYVFPVNYSVRML